MTRVLSLICLTAAALVATGGGVARAAQPAATDAPVDHAHMHHAVGEAGRVVSDYAVPDLEMVREDGTPVHLGQEMDDGRPVVLAFIYTSCTTVCPLVSHTLADLQRRLGERSDRVHLMSISIDPEQDTPARLREYARTFHAGPAWQHYTGTLAASQAAQRAFGVYRGNKMDHTPATLVRVAPGAAWVRINGFATADQLLAELPALSASR